MSDGAQCACLTVKYLEQRAPNGGVSGTWCCTSCGNRFIPWGQHRWLRDEAVRKELEAVCVKKPEAGTMSGELAGAVLEEALKSDVKAKELGDPGTRHAAPRPTAPDPIKQVLAEGLLRDSDRAGEVARHKFVPQESSPTEGDLPAPSVATIKAELKSMTVQEFADTARKPPTNDLPSGIKLALWIPMPQQDGTTLFQCSVEGFGLRAQQTSRSKQKALAYCLEDLARQMIEADRG